MAWQGSKTNGASATQTATTETSSAGAVNIQIGGQKLTVKSDKDPALVAEIAAYVDDKVSDLRAMAPNVALDKLLILASMTVAEELFESRARLDTIESALETRVKNCLAALDKMEESV